LIKSALIALTGVLIIVLAAQTPPAPGARDKSNAIARLGTDGRWSVEPGNPIVRSSVKLYRNGLRQTPGLDYALDAANPHFLRPIGEPWPPDDQVLMDYLY
jgi:hypothetical protein